MNITGSSEQWSTPGTAGPSSFTVRVTDSASVTTTKALSLTINPAALSITTSSLPAGTVDVAYSQALGPVTAARLFP
jgi:hypothetical protein